MATYDPIFSTKQDVPAEGTRTAEAQIWNSPQYGGYNWDRIAYAPGAAESALMAAYGASEGGYQPGGFSLGNMGAPLGGSRAGIFKNADGTFTVNTILGAGIDGGRSDQHPYYTANYALQTGDDGKQYLVRQTDFTRYQEADSRDNWDDFAKWAAVAAAGYGAATYAGAGAAGAGATEAAAGTAATGSTATGAGTYSVNGALMESAAGASGYGVSSASGGYMAAYDAAIAAGATPEVASAAANSAAYQQAGWTANPEYLRAGSTAGASPSSTPSSPSTPPSSTPKNTSTTNYGRLAGTAASMLAGAGGSSSSSGAGAGGGIEGAAAAASRLSNAQAEGLEFATQQAREEAQRRRDIFIPLENRLAAQAQEYDTPERRAQMMARAGADVERNAGMAMAEMNRDRLRRGGTTVDGSTRSAGLDLALGTARARAGATDAAVKDVEQQGYARMMDAAGIGRGVFQSQATQQQLGISAGNSAINGQSAAGNLFATQQRMNQIGEQQHQQNYANWGSLLGDLYSAWSRS